MAKIFLNFQVGDGDQAAALFDERLSREFGPDEVFRSSRSIGLGLDYPPELLDGVRNCRVMLVLMGSRWNAEALHKPGNWVHREIAEALARDKLVVPVLFEKDAAMPAAADLPEDIRDLVSRQNFKSNHRDVHVWLEFLLRELVKLEPELGIGVVPGLEDLVKWWRAHVDLTGLPGHLPLTGREDAVQAIESWLAEPPSVRVLRGARALTRRLVPGRETPPWAAPPVSPLTMLLVLAGAWTDADHAVLEQLTGTPYEDVERFARNNSGDNDPFLHRSGARWQLADVQDAWALLRGRLTTADAARWSRLAFEVLFGADASKHLRRGVLQGLAVAGTTGDAHAQRVVVELLRHANDNPSGERWVVLADALPLLAEAAPELFLDEVLAGLSGKDPALAHTFTDARHGHSAHTYLLWALGRLCWSAEHLLLGVRALGRLAELDPDPNSNYRSRPEELLQDVLLPVIPFMPFTAAPDELRRAAISDVCRRYPDVGWRLVLRFLSGELGVHALTDRPEFRDWPAGLVRAPRENWVPTFEHLVELALTELPSHRGRPGEVRPTGRTGPGSGRLQTGPVGGMARAVQVQDPSHEPGVGGSSTRAAGRHRSLGHGPNLHRAHAGGQSDGVRRCVAVGVREGPARRPHVLDCQAGIRRRHAQQPGLFGPRRV